MEVFAVTPFPVRIIPTDKAPEVKAVTVRVVPEVEPVKTHVRLDEVPPTV